MTEEVKVALVILERAMGIEEEGGRFYRKAARSTRDKKGQEMFAMLADDEKKHYDLIKRQHTALTSEGRWESTSMIKPAEIDLGKPLFPGGVEALKKGVTDKAGDWEALLFGLDIEAKSYDFYRQAALKIKDPPGKQILVFLAGQEQSHFDVLMMRYDSLFGPISWQS